MFTRTILTLGLAVSALFVAGRPAMADKLGGPVSWTMRAPAQDERFHRFLFRGGERATVYVLGDWDTDLDVYVYDADGRMVARDIDRTDQCVVSWTPERTGYFTIKVKNLGDVYNEYRLAVE